jgi:hypothetical protein
MNVARRISQIISECNEAQRRLTYLRLSYDQYMTQPDTPPETFSEFMLRTSGPLRREPSARQRLAGRGVR